MTTERARPRRADDVTGSDLGSEYLVRAGTDGRVHVLNASAREIYLLSDGTRDVDALGSALASAFGIPLELAARDARDAVADMVRLGLLVEE